MPLMTSLWMKTEICGVVGRLPCMPGSGGTPMTAAPRMRGVRRAGRLRKSRSAPTPGPPCRPGPGSAVLLRATNNGHPALAPDPPPRCGPTSNSPGREIRLLRGERGCGQPKGRSITRRPGSQPGTRSRAPTSGRRRSGRPIRHPPLLDSATEELVPTRSPVAGPSPVRYQRALSIGPSSAPSRRYPRRPRTAARWSR